ncbi:hypothetical protein ABIA30_005478, partial [Mycobacterium sp. MAA66]
GIDFRARMGSGDGGYEDPVGQAVAPLIAEGLALL